MVPVKSTWLEQGHGDRAGHLVSIEVGADGPRAGDPGVPSAPAPRTRIGALVAAWAVTAIAAAGAVWAVRDALYPVAGTATVSVWENPGRTATTSSGPVTTPPAAVAVVPAAAVDTTEVDTAEADVTSSVEDESEEPSPATVAAQTPETVDDHGGDRGRGGSDKNGSNHGSGSGGNSGSGHGSDG
jgi:hypothetical protein